MLRLARTTWVRLTSTGRQHGRGSRPLDQGRQAVRGFAAEGDEQGARGEDRELARGRETRRQEGGAEAEEFEEERRREEEQRWKEELEEVPRRTEGRTEDGAEEVIRSLAVRPVGGGASAFQP